MLSPWPLGGDKVLVPIMVDGRCCKDAHYHGYDIEARYCSGVFIGLIMLAGLF
jgi:hypothetical protein